MRARSPENQFGESAVGSRPPFACGGGAAAYMFCTRTPMGTQAASSRQSAAWKMPRTRFVIMSALLRPKERCDSIDASRQPAILLAVAVSPIGQFREQQARERFRRVVAKPRAFDAKRHRFHGHHRTVDRVRRIVRFTVKVDANAASGRWTLEALVSCHDGNDVERRLAIMQAPYRPRRAAPRPTRCAVRSGSARRFVRAFNRPQSAWTPARPSAR